MPGERVRRIDPNATAATLARMGGDEGQRADGRARLTGLLVEAQRRLKANDGAGALRACREALALAPEHPDALNLLSVAHGQLRRPAEGEGCSRRALAIRPRDAGFRLNLGNRLQEQGRLDEAIEAWREGLADAPSNLALRKALARALFAAGCHAEAREVASAAGAWLEGDPEHLGSLGEVLASTGDVPGALALYRAALEARPERTEWWLQLTRLALRMEQLDVAMGAAERVLEQWPGHDEACIMLAAVLLRARDFARMAQTLALIADGSDQAANARNLTGLMLFAQARVGDGLAAMRDVEHLAPDAAVLQMTRVMHLNYDPEISREALAEEHRAFGRRFADATAPALARFDRARDPERRLRIGYLSPDLRNHSVAYFTAPIFEAFDRERFDVVAYAHVPNPDGITAHLRELVTEWRDVTYLGDGELAQRIEDDGIDILVELAGLTKNSRMLACTGRPAPIQIAYLGYPNTTGLPQIDYRITDHVADPWDADELHSETLIRLPRCFLAYAIPTHAPAIEPPPVERNGFVTFGSFNNLAKVNRKAIGLWAEVLRAVPSSRLLLKATGTADPATQSRLRDEFSAADIDADRICFAGYAPTAAAHLATYHEIDIALDTFPYNGTTTTCEALWMGVPVITLAGDRHAARVGASLLSTIGFQAGIANSPEEYVLTARVLAERPELLKAARGNLRTDMRRSPLCDMQGHARALEEAYRAVWRIWCAEA